MIGRTREYHMYESSCPRNRAVALERTLCCFYGATRTDLERLPPFDWSGGQRGTARCTTLATTRIKYRWVTYVAALKASVETTRNTRCILNKWGGRRCDVWYVGGGTLLCWQRPLLLRSALLLFMLCVAGSRRGRSTPTSLACRVS